MTDITALDELIKAVEAGRDNSELWRPAISDKPFTAMKAFHGSLDAAKALHDALLPMWGYRVSPSYAIVMKPNISGKHLEFDAIINSNPARAWLLAILRAYRAQIGGAA